LFVIELLVDVFGGSSSEARFEVAEFAVPAFDVPEFPVP